MRARSILGLLSGALLLLASHPARAQYRFELTRANDDAILAAPRRVIAATTRVEGGNWNIKLSNGHGIGANHKAPFSFVSGQEESFKVTYDRVNQTFRFDVM